MISPTSVRITCDTEAPVYAYIAYGPITPGSEIIDWQTVYHTTTAAAHQVFDLTNLEPNAEYVYLVCASASSDWANPATTEYRSFVTKTTDPSVEFPDLVDRQGVSSLSQIVVRASDAAYARFNPRGISKVELYVDGKQLTACTQSTLQDHIECTFNTTALGLTDGVHELEAVAYDDYWRSSRTHVTVLVDPSGDGIQSLRVSGSQILDATGQGTAKGVPKKKGSAQAVQQISLKHALKVLLQWKTAQGSWMQGKAQVAERLLQSWISQGHDLAKGNSSQMNAIAFMLYNLGGYKKTDNCGPRAGRRTMGPGQNKCVTAVGDAFVLGNKHRNLRWGRDWATKDVDWPENAAALADRNRSWPYFQTVAEPGSVGDFTAYGHPAGGLRFWRTTGHIGLYLGSDTTISANGTDGIRFSTWKQAYRDVAKASRGWICVRKYTR